MNSSFRAAVEARDLEAIRATLHPDVVFRSPAVYKPYEGVETVMHLLSAVMRVLEDFRYLDELHGEGDTHALIFEAKAGGREVQGLDYLRTDADGLVTELWVMIRPLSGLSAVAQAMASELGIASPSPPAA
jgi:ketosteroid isomerase-like protein